MTNWKKFKIVSKKIGNPNSIRNSFIVFGLDGSIPASNRCEDLSLNQIFIYNSYPFDTYQVGDYIEIDTDKTKREESGYVFDDDKMVRKPELYSSSFTGMTIGSTTITREHGLAIARQLDAYVDQSGGTKEYTASIEVQDNQGKPIKFSISSKKAN